MDNTHWEEISWRAPSNIAIIKYWGKSHFQIPNNPSFSLTLQNSFTETKVRYRNKAHQDDGISLQYFFEGKENPQFTNRVLKYIEVLRKEHPFLTGYDFEIHSTNSFPHSSGIASSASSMAALALSILTIQKQVTGSSLADRNFFKVASDLARRGSGSASRSVYGPFALWGKTELFDESSDAYAIPITENIHSDFNGLKNAILIVSKGKKELSSSFGHELMDDNVFSEARYHQANQNLKSLMQVLKNGDKNGFFRIVENEALSLHAMIMSSMPWTILMKPNTLHIIDAIKKARELQDLDMGFTLDAGANIHVLYFENQQDQIKHFIEKELTLYCEEGKWIDDTLGNGPIRLM